jgi:DNA-binding response OmpR family regulator
MKKILLVNSVLAALEKEKGFLARADFRILAATSGKDALRIHREEKADLIVADMDTHDMGGDLLCSLVRQDKQIRNVSCLLVCSNSADDLKRVARCGANGWIARPVDAARLLAKVEQLLAISTRSSYRVLVRVKVHGTTDTETFFCTSENISASGILIETDNLLNRGDRITCSFFLPGSKQIVAEGEVVRSAKKLEETHQYGVRFVNLSPDASEEIEKFIAAAIAKS